MDCMKVSLRVRKIYNPIITIFAWTFDSSLCIEFDIEKAVKHVKAKARDYLEKRIDFNNKKQIEIQAKDVVKTTFIINWGYLFPEE